MKYYIQTEVLPHPDTTTGVNGILISFVGREILLTLDEKFSGASSSIKPMSLVKSYPL